MTAAPTLVREEEAADRDRVHEVNARAFETDAEARLVDALRGVADPMISLVALVEGLVVGHILFTPVSVESTPKGALCLALGPMAVVPELQRRGIGSALVRAGLERCRTLGAIAVFVLGHPDYYPRFGFEPARPHGLWFRDETFDPYFMVLPSSGGSLASLSGEVHYLPPFDEA